MRALLQRVTEASVRVNGEVIGSIESGLLVFVGVALGDTVNDVDHLVEKCRKLRIFTDENDKMNLSVEDIGGAVLCVSQFTLAADTAKGLRPSFSTAMPPEKAEKLYDRFVSRLREAGIKVETGSFGADMKVSLLNDGPVTFLLESSGR